MSKMQIYDCLADFDRDKYKDCNIIATIGNFDGIHSGHQKIIRQMKEYAKKIKNPLLILISFEPNTRLFFNPTDHFLINTKFEKTYLCKQFDIDILLFLQFNPEIQHKSAERFIEEILIKKIGINHLMIGKNFYFGYQKSGDQNLLKKYSNFFNVFLINLEGENNNKLISNKSMSHSMNNTLNSIYSSSLIRKLLPNGQNLYLINKFLNYKFFFSGKVIKGNQRGKMLGFPTANIRIPKEKIIPQYGVYKTEILIYESLEQINNLEKQDSLIAIANLGIRPSFHEDNSEPFLEVHILNYDNNLYEKYLIVKFIKFIRPEKKFSSIEELKLQITKDIQNI